METKQARESNSRILNIAFYHFVRLSELPQIRVDLKELSVRLQLRGTILLSPEGINGVLAGEEESVRIFQKEMRSNSAWSKLEFKESYSDKIPFKRMLVKLKKEIIPLGDPNICPEKWTAPRLPAEELKKWLDEGKELILLDTRNDYEIEYGTFKNAVQFKLNHFRNIPQHLKTFSEQEKQKPVVMFCTGGIRCEKASVVAMQSGFKEVYQLDGGILKYFEKCGGDHYTGSCYVFDQRVALDPELKPIQSE